MSTLSPLPFELDSVPKNSPQVLPGPLADVLEYSHCEQVIHDAPELEADWISRLHLQIPRSNVHCLSRTTLFAKRALDIFMAISLLLLLWPVMLLTAIAVKLTSPGPVIYKQTRVGLNLRKKKTDRRLKNVGPPPGEKERRRYESDRRNECKFGKEFTLYKFRTMRNDAERDGAQFAVKGDARVTSIGRFLRKTRLDELPQLWNVLKGEMSMVGPRPERPEFIEHLSNEIPNYIQRLGLKPGLTGLAQIENGYDNDIDSFRKKVTYDLIYLQNCCLWNDIKVLFRTIRVVLTGSGAL